MKSVETMKCTISIHKMSRRACLRRSDPKCNQWLTAGYNGQCLREREQVTSNIDTFESNRNIDLEDRKKGRRWGWKRVKKKKKERKTESEMKWGQSCAERNTGQSDRLSSTKLVCRGSLCLMDMFSPCQGRLQRKVLPVRARWGGVEKNWTCTGGHGPYESLWSTVNWSLWGQGPRPQARHSMGHSFFL